MPSFKTVFLAVAAALVGTVRADYFVEPSSVPLTTRSEHLSRLKRLFKFLRAADSVSSESWCQSEISTCPSICRDQSGTGAQVNTCDPVRASS